VALGDSFAAGFSDGALFVKGQEGAYTNLLSQQFALLEVEIFKPLTLDNIGELLGGNVIQGTRLYFDGKGLFLLRNPTEVSNRLTGPLYGVPGAKVFI
jgi:hypothetical protein